MKVNTPVTNNEILMKEDTILVTRTDLKGRITYANDAFIAISGFSKHELIGANHNVVRHPDMPPAAFKDLWDTVRAGETWQGYVKNLRKDGGYYWVKATVIPNVRQGKVIGYTSVRRKPSREMVERSIEIYRSLR